MHCCFKKNEIILLLDNEKIKYPIDMQNGHWLKELFLAPSIFNIMFLNCGHVMSAAENVRLFRN